MNKKMILLLAVIIMLTQLGFAAIAYPPVTVTVTAVTEAVDGTDTLAVNWNITANSAGVQLRGSSGLRLAYDNTVLKLISNDGANTEYSITETLSGMRSASRLGAYEGAITDVRAALNSSGTIGYLTIELGHPEYTLNCEQDDKLTLASVRFAYRSGKSQPDLRNDSIRLMTISELENMAQPAAVNISVAMTNANAEYVYSSRSMPDSLNAPLFDIPYTNGGGASPQNSEEAETPSVETPNGETSEESQEDTQVNPQPPDASNGSGSQNKPHITESNSTETDGITFTDIDSVPDWARTAVEFAARNDFIVGLDANMFKPTENAARGMFTATLMKAYGIRVDAAATDNFSDVDSNKAYAPFLATAKKNGIAAGIGDNKFAPEQSITRQEMFVLLYRVLVNIGEIPEKSMHGKSLSDFTDSGQVAAWAIEPIDALLQAGMINGTGNNELSPELITDRSTMAQIIYNLLAG